MLTLELSGQKYNKAAFNRELHALLNSRSKQAIEFKHCNISAVLLHLGFPTIAGYKPRKNFQKALIEEVINQLSNNPVLDQAALQAVEQIAVLPKTLDYAIVNTPPPKPEKAQQSEAAPSYLQKRDYMAIEASNRSLGLAGELFILEYENWKLREAGQKRLAEKIEHTSVTDGDGAGFDIMSFDVTGKPKYIEVKTTAYSEKTPFWISANELRFAEDNDVHYRLARVYDFRKQPRFFSIAGPVQRHCDLNPNTYKASLK